MKTFLISLTAVLILSIALYPPAIKCFADQTSLPAISTGKKSTDIFQVYGNAVNTGGAGVNWTQMTNEIVAGINWTAIVFSSNSVNWAQLPLPTRN